MTHIVVDMDNPTPPYEQVRREVLEQIRGGELTPGDRLPAIRVLAGDLGLAAGTVARAYKELEEAGILRTRRGAGTTVAPGAEIEARRQLGALRLPEAGVADPTLVELLTAAIGEARARGADDAAILAAVRAVLAHRR